jgi:peptidoglycan/xylan/chitin deacetylase (PgdA/CDA1 family)
MNIIPALCAAAVLLLLFALRLLRRAGRGPVVLAYDNIGVAPRRCRRKQLWVSQKKFRGRLARMAAKGARFISARDFIEGNAGGPETVLLTFNSGYENFYTAALPVLKELKIPALVFLYTDGIGRYDFWHDAKYYPWQNMLTAEQIKEIKKTNLITFGSRGLTDIDLAAAPPETAANQITESAARLKNLFDIRADFYKWPAATKKPPPAAKDLAVNTYKFVFGKDMKQHGITARAPKNSAGDD